MNNTEKLLDLSFECSKTWNDLDPAEGGRHCSKCDKVLVDLSEQTPIDAYRLSQDPNACANIPESYLQIPSPKLVSTSSWKSIFIFCVILCFGPFLFNGCASSKQKCGMMWKEAHKPEVNEDVEFYQIIGARQDSDHLE